MKRIKNKNMPEDEKNVVGEKIREYRIAKKLNQEDVAQLLIKKGVKINQKTLSRIEIKKRSVYDFELIAIAEVLGVKIQDLYP